MAEADVFWTRELEAARRVGGAGAVVWIARETAPHGSAARREWRADRFAALAWARSGRSVAPRLVHDEHGRPSLAGASGAFLSAADRDGWTLTAIAGVPIGVDVETARPAPPWPTDLFHPEEARWLAGLDDGAAAEAFGRLWVAKEAWAKAFSVPIDAALAERVVLSRQETSVLPPWERVAHVGRPFAAPYLAAAGAAPPSSDEGNRQGSEPPAATIAGALVTFHAFADRIAALVMACP